MGVISRPLECMGLVHVSAYLRFLGPLFLLRDLTEAVWADGALWDIP